MEARQVMKSFPFMIGVTALAVVAVIAVTESVVWLFDLFGIGLLTLPPFGTITILTAEGVLGVALGIILVWNTILLFLTREPSARNIWFRCPKCDEQLLPEISGTGKTAKAECAECGCKSTWKLEARRVTRDYLGWECIWSNRDE